MRVLVYSALLLICGLTLTPAQQKRRTVPPPPEVGSIVITVRKQGDESTLLSNVFVLASWQEQGTSEFRKAEEKAKGTYVIAGLRQNTYRVDVTAPAYQSWQANITVKKFVAKKIVIDLPPKPAP